MIKKIIVIEEEKAHNKKFFIKKVFNMENEIKNGKEKDLEKIKENEKEK